MPRKNLYAQRPSAPVGQHLYDHIAQAYGAVTGAAVIQFCEEHGFARAQIEHVLKGSVGNPRNVASIAHAMGWTVEALVSKAGAPMAPTNVVEMRAAEDNGSASEFAKECLLGLLSTLAHLSPIKRTAAKAVVEEAIKNPTYADEAAEELAALVDPSIKGNGIGRDAKAPQSMRSHRRR